MSTPSSFIASASEHLTSLCQSYESALSSADTALVSQSLRHASYVRHALLVYRGARDVLGVPSSSARNVAVRSFLVSALERLQQSLHAADYDELDVHANAIHSVLDGLVHDDVHDQVFTDCALETDDVENQHHKKRRRRRFFSKNDVDNDEIDSASSSFDVSPSSPMSFLSLLSKKQKMIVGLYFAMVLASIAAIAVITSNFINQLVHPSGFITSSSNSTLRAPVVTICLSQSGIPFSRLQLFNFTDASGVTFRGADPRGLYMERSTPEFNAVVERFWDNPDGERCNETVGDFFPFPLTSLNDLVAGRKTTQCRQCYRVGRKQNAYARDTSFANSSVLSLYTDNYFLQCMKSDLGLHHESLNFLHEKMFEQRANMSALGVLSRVDTTNGDTTVNALSMEAFQKVTSDQACNIFYFAFFPASLKRSDPDVDIRYAYNGTSWNAIGVGPYFESRSILAKSENSNNTTAASEFLPTEALQMFVSGLLDSRQEQNKNNNNNSDMILIGPNTQTYATFRRLMVFGRERYDISSSTSNLFQSDVVPIFGYWLVYRIYYNFNRFITDEWYSAPTYSAGQWVVDVMGYLSLFTGVSVFSLLAVPLLKAMRKREKERLLRKRPEGFVWSKRRKMEFPDRIVGGKGGKGGDKPIGENNVANDVKVLSGAVGVRDIAS